MNSSSGTIHGPAIYGVELWEGYRRVIAFVIVLALLVVAGLLLSQAYNAMEMAAPLAGEHQPATTGEIVAVESYAAWRPSASIQVLLAQEAFLARNPELKLVARYHATGDNHRPLAQDRWLPALYQ